MKTKLNIKANQLIDERNRISTEISRYWNIIATENVIKKGAKRNYDLKQLLIRIKALYDQSVIVKLRIQCANIGIKIKDLPKDANIINIYKLSAYNEYCVKLEETIRKHTINPIIKIKKGKKVAILALGDFYGLGQEVADEIGATLVNPVSANILDKKALDQLAADHELVVTLEDNSLDGGFGQKVASYSGSKVKVLNYGQRREYTDQTPLEKIYRDNHLTKEQITTDIKKVLAK